MSSLVSSHHLYAASAASAASFSVSSVPFFFVFLLLVCVWEDSGLAGCGCSAVFLVPLGFFAGLGFDGLRLVSFVLINGAESSESDCSAFLVLGPRKPDAGMRRSEVAD